MEENFQKKIENDEKESALQKNNFILKIDNQNNLIKDLETKITFLENVLSQNQIKEKEEESIKFNQKQEINNLNEQILSLERELKNSKISSSEILSKQKNEIEEKMKIMSGELEAAKQTNTAYEFDYHSMKAFFDSEMERMRKIVDERVAVAVPVPVSVSVGVGVGVGVVRSEAPLSGNGRDSGHGSGNGSGGGSGGGSEDSQVISILQSQVLSFKQQLNK